MDVRTKRVKRVLRDPEIDVPGTSGERIAIGDELAVPYREAPGGVRYALTVLWRGRTAR